MNFVSLISKHLFLEAINYSRSIVAFKISFKEYIGEILSTYGTVSAGFQFEVSCSFLQLAHFHLDTSSNELLIYKPYFGLQCVYEFELLVHTVNGSVVNQLGIQ